METRRRSTVWEWVGGIGVALILLGVLRALGGASGGVMIALFGVTAVVLSRVMPGRPRT